ncbi:phosphate acyltransferase PlsX [Cerasicoccus arenae]|uniref:Phosphate acyltransferase n=1 Tax=Cerasicoccus arenae TaxID=424488 RepID=A0A8J3DHZ5_9BACT|nr:phosphate acyltransferase PlsX [Cerasicoccus arenae]MBK1858798.1 phosphate acyltransferase PlsX [Cerasicoccus arenae]GHC04531.1 phosphate acyltransferase [Cerasicoccus arenae]
MSSRSASDYPIAVDAMGGDLGPAEVVAAAHLALKEVKGLNELILVGDEGQLGPLLKGCGLDTDSRVRICHAPEVIGMKEKPKESYKKKDSSMITALKLVADGEAGAVVSCGNTGSLMFSATLMLRKLPGVERPALATIIPSRDHHFLLIDAGAQPETSPKQLAHNAILGSAYYAAAIGKERPRVGLLTIGTEEGKGTKRITETHDFLKALGEAGIINYLGPIEGFDTFKNVADVVVCDGFTGNILLKTLESCYGSLKETLKDELMATPMRKLGTFLAQGAFKAMKKTFSPDNYSGAPLLGLNHLVLKTHGSSDRYFIRSAIRIGLETLRHDMDEQVQKDIEKGNGIMKAPAMASVSAEN